jgi:hypothetical protein
MLNSDKMQITVFLPEGSTKAIEDLVLAEVKEVFKAHGTLFAGKTIEFVIDRKSVCWAGQIKVYADQLGDIEPRDKGRTKPVKEKLRDFLRDNFNGSFFFRPEGSRGTFVPA